MGNKNSAPNEKISIPSLPGKPSSSASGQCKFASVEIPFKASWNGNVTADTTPTLDTISGPNFGGSGWVLKACYLPTAKLGPNRPIEVKQTSKVFSRSAATKANLFFSHSGAQALETVFYEANITLQAGFFSVDAESFEPLFQAIKMAGEKGFSVSCVIDSCETRLSGLLSADTTVTLVCQRPAGIPLSPRNTTHVVVGVPVTMKQGFRKVDCEAPTLQSTLDEYGQQGYRLAASYDPPVINQKGIRSASSVILLIFEKVDVPMSFFVATSECVARGKWFDVDVQLDHSAYQELIEGFTSEGWEFASALDVPKARETGLNVGKITVCLIFAAPTSWRQAALSKSAAIVSTPPLDKNADAPPPYETTL